MPSMGTLCPLKLGRLLSPTGVLAPVTSPCGPATTLIQNFATQPATTPQILALGEIPEPGSLALLGVGLGGLAAAVRARRRGLIEISGNIDTPPTSIARSF